jgi:hypothetical protein
MGPNLSQSTWTVMAWVFITTAPGAGVFNAIVVENSTGTFFLEASGANGSISFDSSPGGGSAASFSINTWYHVAATSAGQIYINGSASGSAGSGAAVNFGVGNWTVCQGSGDGGWAGVIDDVRIFNTVESASSITTWMNTPVGGAPAKPPSLIMQTRRAF